MATGKSFSHTIAVPSYNKGTGYVRFDFQEYYDVAGNYSTIALTGAVITHTNYSGKFYVNATIKTADGVEIATLSGNTYSGNTGAAVSGTFPLTSGKIYHDGTTGAKTVTINVVVDSLFNNSAGWISNSSGSFTVALTTIPRLSEISTGNGTLGVAQKLTVTQKSTSYTHTIKWTCGSASGTIATKSSELSFNWTPAMDLASQNTTGTSVSVKFTITTYSGDTSIGSKTLTITCAIPASVKPSVTMTITDANGYTGKYGGYVQLRSRLRVVLNITEAYGSAITVNNVSFENVTYQGTDITTNAINGNGTLSVKATVTDKRGRTGTATVNVDVLAYSPPAITGLTYNRADSDGTDNVMGEYAEVTMSGKVTSLGGANRATYRLQYKKLSDSAYTDFDMTGYNDVYTLSKVVAIFAASADYSYNIIFTVSDDFSAAFNSTAKTEFILQTGKVLMHRRAKGNGMGLGRICEEDDLLDVDWNIRGRKDLQIDGSMFGGLPLIPITDYGYDCNDIILYGGGKLGIYQYSSITLNTPYKAGIWGNSSGYIINIPSTTVNADGKQYGTQIAIGRGTRELCVRNYSGTTQSTWTRVALLHDNSQHFRFYTNPTQFGCTNASTLTEVFKALPSNSVFLYTANLMTDASWNFPVTSATLRIEKQGGARSIIQLFPAYGINTYYMQLQSGDNVIPNGTWKRTDANGAVTKKLLWTNASPTSSFAAQTLTLNLNAYDSVLIVYRVLNNQNYEVTHHALKGSALLANATSGTSSNDFSRMTTVNSANIVFEAGAQGSSSNVNTVMIPYKIFGVKDGY